MILDDEVLKAIDDKVGQRGRSRFLVEAAREKLAINEARYPAEPDSGPDRR